MPTPTRLYVGRLSNDIRRRDLEYFFRGCGRINEILIKEGFAFVEIDDDRDAREAIRKLNGRTVNGCRVHVEYSRGERRRDDRRDRYEDRDRHRDRDRDDRRSLRYGKPRNTEFSVKVENLSSRVSWQDLKDFMRTADVEVTYADANRRERGVGFVDFATASDMRVAIQKLDGTDLFGRKVRMEEKKRRSRSRSRSRSPVRRRSRTRSRSRSASRSRSRSRSASKNRDSEVSRSPKSDGGSERSRSASPANGIEENGRGDRGDSPRHYNKSPRSNPMSDDERARSEE